MRKRSLNHVRHILVLLCLPVALLPFGCAHTPVDPAPDPVFDVPEIFVQAGAADPALPTPWWTTFADPVLNDLVDTALADNLSLAQGLARIERAGALFQQANALRKPTLDLQAGLRREWERVVHRDDPAGPDLRSRVDDLDQAINAFNNGTPVDLRDDQAAEPRNQWQTPYDLGVLLQWELDIWGRLESATRAEAERLFATTSDFESLLLTISAQVVEAYFQAMEQRLQLALLDEQLALAEDFQQLIELRFLQGGASSVDLLQQRSQVAEIKAEMPVARARLGLLENRLDTLLGSPVDGAPRTETPTPALPATTELVHLGIPAEVLMRRPDLQAAQRRVVAANYDVAAAVADRLPRITLDGSLVFGGTGESAAFTALGGLGLFQPLLDWGRRRAVADAAQAAFMENLYAFSERYLGAIEEVETTLWQETQQRELVMALAEREEILQHTLAQTRLRYSQGVTDYLPVLTAQQELQEVQREILQQKRLLVSLRVQLFRAIGGPTTPEVAASTETPAPQPA